MDIKSTGGKLINVTEYGKKMPPVAPPAELAIKKENKRMATEMQNLNNAEKIAPNPLFDKKQKAPKPLGAKGLKDLTKDELDELLKLLANTEETDTEDVLGKFAANLEVPRFGSVQSPAYRFPGFFNG
ncbi:MAG: hypothetical protein EBQ92_01700 [Proteobacteria bacterium]|nr:hypothetical protein [Pseudomonadota bacterium]